MDAISIVNNEKEQQFQVMVGPDKAFLEYRLNNGVIFLMHTEVPDKLSGRGIASALATYAMEYARSHDLPVKVYCPFVAAWLQKHPEYHRLVIPPPAK